MEACCILKFKMHHIAIMKKSWGLLPKILAGEKTVESRWFKTKRIPWDKVKAGDTLWFKNAGEPVSLKVIITKVLQFSNLNNKRKDEIIKKYGESDLGLSGPIPKEIADYFENKNYCLLVFFKDVEAVKPFKINKKGFGAMTAWISIEDIVKIKKGLF